MWLLQERNRGVRYILVAVSSFAVMNALAKSLHRIPAHELILFRSVVAFSYCAWYVRKHHIPFFGRNKVWLLTRGLVGFVALLLFFITLRRVPLATASTLQYLSPFFTVLFASLLNDQRVKHIQWLFFLVSFSGILVLKGFDTSGIPAGWLLAGVASAALAGFTYNAVIKAQATDHPMTIVMYSPMVCIPITAIWSGFHFVMPQGLEWLLLLLMGAFAQTGQYFTTLALQSDAAGRVTPWNYTGAVLALLIGYLFFDEKFTIMSIVGMLLIVTGVVLNARVKF